MNTLALDVSLTSTGIAYYNPNYSLSSDEEKWYVSRITPKGMKGIERIAHVASIVRSVIHERIEDCRLLVIEGPAFGMQQNNTRAHSLGELHGAIKFFAYEANLDILTAPPSCLKKFVTGRGNATKEEVIAGVKEMWDMDLPHDDEADAFGLLQLGMAFQSVRERRRYDGVRRDALTGCHLFRR
jgi:Holliday junction resolvasome RuvABC endonuclease subunit